MYLKSLEVTGFKSFPQKTVLEFSPGITAVVGPNGCGKSNLLDAVRWVLGEQSAKLLRGGKMEDLIFSGTAGRKALNFAEVSLLFDRADLYLPLEYREVAVTRRLYRSGEGEYFLNKTPCRLKDITELFLDTGIGTETYSMIGQGKVERLINARPEERRELFEEAAGIHKYKQRKKEAGTRLDELKGNLLRITDLLSELEGQNVLLAEVAAKAEEYQDLYSKLQNLEKKILLQRWWEKVSLLQKISDDRQAAESSFAEQKETLERLHQQARDIETRGKIAAQKLEEFKGLCQEKKGIEVQLQGKLALIQEQKKYMKEKTSLKETASREVAGRLAGLENTLQKNRDELEGICREQEKLGMKAAAFKTELQELQRSKDLSYLQELRARLGEKNLQKAALQQLLENNSLRSHELHAALDQLQKKEENIKNSLVVLQKAEEELLTVLERNKWEIAEQGQSYQLLGQRRTEFRLQREKKNENLRKMESEWQKKKARLKYLQEGEEYFNLYSRGVRAVMQAAAKNLLQGILGPVANLITVPAELEKAIEVALGVKLQFIVVTDDFSAREAIEFLKTNKVGKATFLPLNLLRVAGRKAPGPLSGEILGVASGLVEAAPQCKKAVDYLLGFILVAVNLEAALKLARNDQPGWRIVTLDGEMITPGGAISGGYQPRERSSFLERKRELKELEKEIINLESQTGEQEKDLQAFDKGLEELACRLAEADARLRELTGEKIKIQSDLQGITAEKKRTANEYLEYQQEENTLQAKCDAFATEEAAGKKEYAALKIALATAETELENASSRVYASEEKFKKIEHELVEIRIKFASLQERESFLQGIILKQSQEKTHLQELAAGLAQEKKKLREELSELHLREGEMQGALEQEKSALKQLEEFEAQQKSVLNLCLREREEHGPILNRGQRLLEKYERHLRKLDIERIRLEEAGRYLEESLREKFMFRPDKDNLNRQQAAEPVEDLIREKGLLETKLSGIGEVNLGAIEEYARLQKRINFLGEQRKDLLSGEKGMQKLIAELDEHMTKKMLKALRSIENHFLDIFKKLFGGGQAFLKYSNPENVLAAEIDIIAQPPGKKLQNISLLSGGEKALTAVTLLFALLKYKPVPFCILDEIESSLDENNLAKFINYLRKYTGETQFIMITHRRRTMEEADYLYGVTMEEQGISKVVSLNLNEKVG